MKHRVKYEWTYECLAKELGLEYKGEVINVIVDPTREIVSLVVIPSTQDEISEVYEASEFRSIAR